MDITVSIITATHNSACTVARTVESVLAQTVPPKEYIVFDGLSTDNTVEIIESYREQFDQKGIKLIVRSESDSGMYDAINKGVELATGDIIGNVNSDDYYEPIAVETVIDTYKKTGFGMMYADLRIVKPTGNIVKKAKLKKFATTRYWNHPTTFITKEVYKEYQYKLESMYDDCDLMLRIRKSPHKVVVVNKILSNFCFGGMSTQKNLDDVIERIKIRCKIYKNNGYGFIYYIDSFLMEFVKFILA